MSIDRRRWIQVAGGLMLAPRALVAGAPAGLDAVYRRFDAVSPEYDNGFVEHQTMAAEVLDRLGAAPDRFPLDPHLLALKPSPPVVDWRARLGAFDQFVGWADFFSAEVAHRGWRAAAGHWAERLASGVGAHLFHGVIRAAHATGALARHDTPARRRELVNALSYWAARYGSGVSGVAVKPPGSDAPAPDPEAQVAGTAISAALTFERTGGFSHLHAVTGSMAAHRLLPLMSAPGRGRLATALTRSLGALDVPPPTASFAGPKAKPPAFDPAAVAKLSDLHAIKLFGAAERGARHIGHRVFGRLMVRAL